MSSSNRARIASNAILIRDAETVGPIRLPMNRADDFIDQFNRTYGQLGIALVPRIEPRDQNERTADASTSHPNR